MIPIVVFWTEYTARKRGSVLKVVPCENCSTEYVYLLEREGVGVDTSVYIFNDDAPDHARQAADETLQSQLDNDFDPVPCPVCGHYQRHMFPKLLETKSLWGSIAMLAISVAGCLVAVNAVTGTIDNLRRPNGQSPERLVMSWSFLLLLSLVGAGLALAMRAKIRRFDPNREDQQVRIAKGRSRAVTREEFEMARKHLREPEAGS